MDLIDRQVAVDAIQQHREDVLGGYKYDEGVAFVYAAAHNHIIDVIKHLPSAQPEIIRCKDCRKNPKWEWVGCPMTGKDTRKPDDFCSYAERKSNG